MPDEIASICQRCGASVYRQHLDSGIARYEGGNLLCAHCVAEYESSQDALRGADTERFEAIKLDDEDVLVAPDLSGSRIMTSTQTLGVAGAWDETRFNRPLNPRTAGAIRCRTFHSKLNENSLQFMNTIINEWVDKNDDIVIKFATSTIGVFEGKHAEPNLILTIFY